MMRFNSRFATRQELEENPILYVSCDSSDSSDGGKNRVSRELWESTLLKEHKDTIQYFLDQTWDDIFGRFRTIIIKNAMETAVLLRIDFKEFIDKPDMVINYFDILSVQVEQLEQENGDVDYQMHLFCRWFFLVYALILGTVFYMMVSHV